MYAALFVSIFAIVFAGQITGVAGLYRWWLVLPLTAAVLIHFYRFANRAGLFTYLDHQLESEGSQTALGRQFSGFCYLVGLTIFLSLVFLPAAAWPNTPVMDTLNWDAGLYHLPKAIEMVNSGNAWDFSISYGEYPFGFESLMAMPILLTRSISALGVLHALIAAFFLLGFWLLLCRYSKLPAGMCLWLSSLVLVSGGLQSFDSNLWWNYWPELFEFGKNDLFLAAILLAAFVFAPIGRSNPLFFSPGLAAASMLALATKPNSVVVVAFLLASWLLRALRSPSGYPLPSLRAFAGLGLILAPVLLWAVRNWLVQGALFSSEAIRLQSGSIAFQLTNPYFHQAIPRQLVMVMVVLAVSSVLAFATRLVPRSILLSALALLLGFALTPASAYLGDTQQAPTIAWRFAIALLAFVLYLLVLWFLPLIRRAYAAMQKSPALTTLASLVVLGLASAMLVLNYWVLDFDPKHARVITDPYPVAVGSDGYYSAFDYIQRNVRGKVVWVENGLPYYVYGPDMSNSITRSFPADLVVVTKTAWHGGDAQYPDMVNNAAWAQAWTLIYEDSQGRVYQRSGVR